MSGIIKWFYPVGIVIGTTGAVLLIGNIANMGAFKVTAKKLSDIAKVRFLTRRWRIISKGKIIVTPLRYSPFGFVKVDGLGKLKNTILYVEFLVMSIGVVASWIFVFSNFRNPFLLLVSAPLWWLRCLCLFFFCFVVVVVGNFVYMMAKAMAARNFLTSRKRRVIMPVPLTPSGWVIPPYPRWCKTSAERLGYFMFIARFFVLLALASTVGITWGLPTWCLFMVSIVFPLRGLKRGLDHLDNKLPFRNPVQTLGLVLLISGAGLEVIYGTASALDYL